jgi:hypothetical protein
LEEVHYETTVPTVLDRFIQQAVMQVLQRQWDRTFSDHSYGFRPGRSARQAVAQAQQYIAEGHGWCVDLDLEKFFDTIPHSALMQCVARRIVDRQMLHLIKMWLQVPCSVTSCSMNSTGSWSAGAYASFDTRTTVIFTYAASGRGSG